MIALANDRMALTLEPDFGARVTSLTDLATGRQWLVAGECVGGDVYLGDQARGWDECFPTVGTCDHVAWGGPLRDHGLLWGRPWQVSASTVTCTATYGDPRFAFCRSLHLQGGNLTATYQITNTGRIALPYLWSQHALLATTPADRIMLHGVGGFTSRGQSFDWPDHRHRDLSAIGTLDEGFSLKLYAKAENAASCGISGPCGGIRFDWCGLDVPAFGLWLDYGGWPPDAPVHQLALEPTTAPADDLAKAESIGAARVLLPGAVHNWTVQITLSAPVSVARPL